MDGFKSKVTSLFAAACLMLPGFVMPASAQTVNGCTLPINPKIELQQNTDNKISTLEPIITNIYRVKVLFCTNRAMDEKTGKFLGNLCEPGQEHQGIATLEHKKGYKTRRQVQKVYAVKALPHERILWKIRAAKTIDTQLISTDDSMAKAIQQMVAESGQPNLDVLDFGSFALHDVNMDFEAASPYCGSSRPILGIDWASVGMPMNQGPWTTYNIDRRQMKASWPYAKHELKLACNAVGRKHVHLWAHSMGTENLADAMLSLYEDEIKDCRTFDKDGNPQLDQFGRLDFFCSDIGIHEFLDKYLPAINALVPAGKRVLYTSWRDFPLLASRFKNHEKRTGKCYPDLKGWMIVRFGNVDAGTVGHSNPPWLKDDIDRMGDKLSQLAAAQAKHIPLRGRYELVLNEKHSYPDCPVYDVKKIKAHH